MKIPLIPTLATFNHEGGRVLFRVDYNVPMEKGIVLNDFKLRSTLATLDFLLNRNCKILLLTHKGRPLRITKEDSTRPLLAWFRQRGYNVAYATTIERVELLFKLGQRIILFENSRFFERDPATRVDFIKALANSTDCYVTDSFATLHSYDYSIILAPRFYAPSSRYVGFLMEKEFEGMKPLATTHQTKIMYVLGGTKFESKLGYISKLAGATSMLCFMPTYSFTFMQALGYSIGISKKESHLGGQLLTFLMLSNVLEKTKIYLPKEYIIAAQGYIEGNLETRTANAFQQTDFGVTIAESCLEPMQEYLDQAEVVFINGAPGFLSSPKTFEPFHKFIKRCALRNIPCIIAGGDTVAAFETGNFTAPNIFTSTGGGSALAFAARTDLPGLQALGNTPFNKIIKSTD